MGLPTPRPTALGLWLGLERSKGGVEEVGKRRGRARVEAKEAREKKDERDGK